MTAVRTASIGWGGHQHRSRSYNHGTDLPSSAWPGVHYIARGINRNKQKYQRKRRGGRSIHGACAYAQMVAVWNPEKNE